MRLLYFSRPCVCCRWGRAGAGALPSPGGPTRGPIRRAARVVHPLHARGTCAVRAPPVFYNKARGAPAACGVGDAAPRCTAALRACLPSRAPHACGAAERLPGGGGSVFSLLIAVLPTGRVKRPAHGGFAVGLSPFVVFTARDRFLRDR